jgi:hypothetical protein
MVEIRKFRRQLEDSFFLKEDQKLIEKYKQLKKMKETKQKLSELSGVQDEAILHRMIELNIRPETLTSLLLVPLIEVAWADGEAHEKEKQAILAAAENKGIVKGGIEHETLEQWMAHKPDAALLEAWIHYTRALCKRLSASECQTLKNELLGRARFVAASVGGFFGMGNRISEAEESVLRKLETAFEGETK